MEGALFCPSGTQSNLLALLYHCERGEEYIVGQKAHTYQYEGGGAAALGSIHPQPLTFESDGTLDFEKVAAVIKPDDIPQVNFPLIQGYDIGTLVTNFKNENINNCNIYKFDFQFQYDFVSKFQK